MGQAMGGHPSAVHSHTAYNAHSTLKALPSPGRKPFDSKFCIAFREKGLMPTSLSLVRHTQI